MQSGKPPTTRLLSVSTARSRAGIVRTVWCPCLFSDAQALSPIYSWEDAYKKDHACLQREKHREVRGW